MLENLRDKTSLMTRGTVGTQLQYKTALLVPSPCQGIKPEMESI